MFSNPGMSGRARIAAVIIFSTLLMAALMLAVNKMPMAAFNETIRGMGYWAPVGFAAIFIIATALGAPTSIFSAAGGVVFGGTMGTVLAVLSATIGATLAFLFTRHFARDCVTRKLGSKPWFLKLNEGLNNSGLYFVMFARVVPVFPFNGTNFASGVTSVSLRDYFLGTLIGVIPANIIFANSASQAVSAVSGEGLDTGALIWLTSLGALVLLTAIIKTRGGAESTIP
jgi:uncharacterized membrane protein YdjX (TVP38/TMEM64 family)